MIDLKELNDKLLHHIISNWGFDDTVGWLLDEGYKVFQIRKILPEITDEEIINILEIEREKALGQI
jgi:hypothetical protein